MAAEDGGKISLDVIPNFTTFGSLFSGGIRSALQTAQSEGSRIGGLLGGGLTTGVTLGVAAAGVAIGEFVSSGIKHFLSLADSARQLERVTGGSAGQVSTFAGIIRKMGGDVDAANRPLGLFAANIATHPDLLQKYNVALAHTKTGQTDVIGTLDNLRQRFVSTADATERDAMAKQLLGRGYQTLLPYLAATNDRIEIYKRLAQQSGEVLTQADIDKARDYKVHLAEVKDEVEQLKTSAGRKGVSFLDSLFQGLDVFSKVNWHDITSHLTDLNPLGFTDAAAKQHDAEQGVKDAMYASAQAAQDEANALAKLDSEEKSVASAAESLQSAQQGQVSAHEAVAKAEAGVTKAAEGVQHAKEGQVRAHEATQSAVESEANAEEKLADLLAKGPVDAKAVESARQSLASTNRSVRDSTESLSAAEQKLIELQQFDAADSADELTQAHLQLSQATLGLAEARLGAARAVPSLNDPYAQQKAGLGVQQAQLAQRQARENLTRINQFGTQADKNLSDAQKQVRDASERVTDSLSQQADAEQKLRDAEAGDPEFAQKVAQAKQAVEAAARGVRDAQLGERDAGIAVRDANQAEVDAKQAVVAAKQNEENATLKVRDAQYALDDAVKAATTDQSTMISALEQKYPELAGIVEQSYGRIANAVTNVPIPDPTGQGLPGAMYDPTTGKLIPTGPMGTPVRKQHGGRVFAGRTYILNDPGPEAVTFGSDATVHSALGPSLTPAGGDGPAIDYGQFADAVAGAVADALEGMGVYYDRVRFGEVVAAARKTNQQAFSGRR